MRNILQWSRMAAVAVVVGTAGCKSLEVTNPNAPDAARAFSDPAAVSGLLTGAMHNWVGARGSYYGVGNLVGMAESYTSSWNNGQYRYYNSIGPVGFFQSDCPQRCGWFNSSSDAKKNPIESMWYSYHSMLSSINDVLTAIRINHVDLGGAAETKMTEAIAVMMEGVVFANIALNYDRGFYVTEATDISNPSAIPFRPRAELRDSAIKIFQYAIDSLTKYPFSASPPVWTGGISGISYSSAQWIKLIRTMQAELLAEFPRNKAENDAMGVAGWAQVATYAAQGLSSGASFDYNVFQDQATILDFQKSCSVNCLFKVHTRIANLVTGGYPPAQGTGPIYHAVYPCPGCPEPQPNSADKRLGDGSWGPTNNYASTGSAKATANQGTDLAWSPTEPFRAVRGTYQQSSMMHIRYSYLSYVGSGTLPGQNGQGLDPVYPATFNDLLWAEGLLRGGGSAVTAANLINKSRVGRGGLAPLTGAESNATLIRALEYEQEVELLGISATAFYNRRRATPEGWQVGTACPGINCLWTATPRQMPVPAKELSVLGVPVYTFGGPNDPDLAPAYASLQGGGYRASTDARAVRALRRNGIQLRQ